MGKGGSDELGELLAWPGLDPCNMGSLIEQTQGGLTSLPQAWTKCVSTGVGLG